MKKMILVLAAILFAGTFQAQAQTDQTYKKELQTYIQNSGSMSTFDQVISQMMSMMGGNLTDAQKEEITTRSVDSLIELMVPLYEKEISLADLKEYNKFFETPAGKRIAEAQPKMVAASMQLGQQWAGKLQQIIQEVMAR